jgi:hypothetical protein
VTRFVGVKVGNVERVDYSHLALTNNLGQPSAAASSLADLKAQITKFGKNPQKFTSGVLQLGYVHISVEY